MHAKHSITNKKCDKPTALGVQAPDDDTKSTQDDTKRRTYSNSLHARIVRRAV